MAQPPNCRTCGYDAQEHLRIIGEHVRCPTCKCVRPVLGHCDSCHAPQYQASALRVMWYGRSRGPGLDCVDTKEYTFCSWRCLLRRLPGLLEDCPFTVENGISNHGPFLTLPYVSRSAWEIPGLRPADLARELTDLGAADLVPNPLPLPLPLTQAQQARVDAAKKKHGPPEPEKAKA